MKHHNLSKSAINLNKSCLLGRKAMKTWRKCTAKKMWKTWQFINTYLPKVSVRTVWHINVKHALNFKEDTLETITFKIKIACHNISVLIGVLNIQRNYSSFTVWSVKTWHAVIVKVPIKTVQIWYICLVL